MSSNSSNALTDNHDEVSDSNVSDFLKRLENLKQTTYSEEKNRAQRLEEEIEEAKRQRLARRPARSQSVSPEKFASSTSSAILCPPLSVVSSQKELATERMLTPNHSFDTSPSLSPTLAVADRETHVVAQNRALENNISKDLDASSLEQIRPKPELQATPMLRTVSSFPILGQDAHSVKLQSNSPASKHSSPLAFKSPQISTMEKIKMWEKSAEIKPTAPITGDEPTVVPMPKADDIERRGKKELEKEELSVSRLETSVDLSSRESESSTSSLATELLTQSESNIDDVKTAQSHACTVNEAAREERVEAKSTLLRRTSTINLPLSTTTASKSQSDANVDKEKDVSDREEERLYKFLRGSRQRSPQKDRLRSNYTPLFPSPSMVSIFQQPAAAICVINKYSITRGLLRPHFLQ
ncbi:uncharacterized protein V1513DRAFT_379150 [Lipomyces chichibuensis]|uniref:uncharacterized protein n=1 Tax=Lipomyces chichibuensis TaxID=1546026 RepID=UPI003342E772